MTLAIAIAMRTHIGVARTIDGCIGHKRPRRLGRAMRIARRLRAARRPRIMPIVRTTRRSLHRDQAYRERDGLRSGPAHFIASTIFGDRGPAQ